MKPTWTITKSSSRAHYLNFPGIEGHVMLSADWHWDNKHCNLKRLAQDLDKTVEKGGAICCFGDFFCAMQGKWDKRASVEELRPEHHSNRYLDTLVLTAADWLMPWLEHLAIISPGNHEQSILERHETDLIDRLVSELRRRGSPVEMGGFDGFIKIRLADATKRATSIMYYHHGYGGGGEVTRGMIDHSRTARQVVADVLVSGHIHRRNIDENVIESWSPLHDGPRVKEQYFVRCGSYKDDHETLWPKTKGRGPRAMGGWLWNPRLHRGKQHNDGQLTLVVENRRFEML